MIVRTIRFVLLCEGTSDRPLVAHLRRLLSSCGATEAVGSAIPLSSIPDHRYHRGSTFARKVQTALAAESEFDLLLVHRDANSAGYEARSREISEAMGIVGRSIDWIPIFPGRQPGRSDEILITRNEVSQGSALNVVSFVVQVRPAVVSFLVQPRRTPRSSAPRPRMTAAYRRRWNRVLASGIHPASSPPARSYIPQTVTGTPSPVGARRKILSAQVRSGARSNTTRWPASAPQRSI